MPIYEFYCPGCEQIFEKLYNKIPKKEPKPTCILCKEYKAKKIISSVGIVFKDADSQTSKKRDKDIRNNKHIAKKFLESEAELSKKRMDNRVSPYQFYDYVPPKDSSKGPRRISDRELKEKQKKAKEITIDLHKRAGTLDKLGKPII